MADNWLLIGLIIGICVGIPVGFVIAKSYSQKTSSVVFDRDSEGRIIGIHYVPMG
jgi:hypothetical protein